MRDRASEFRTEYTGPSDCSGFFVFALMLREAMTGTGTPPHAIRS
jgi:hypothetical protein